MFTKLFEQTISTENLFRAWKEFRRGKASKRDVMRFEYQLEQNIFELHRDLKSRKYSHGPYQGFYITDPKQRHIHKALVRDRVLHHAIYNKLYHLFNPTFIATSFSCRIGKGTHRGVFWLDKVVRKVSRNYTQPVFVLKCDIRKFFDSVDHSVLISILSKRIRDKDMMCLLVEVIESFCSGYSNLFDKKGIPLGNLTSQLFANIYMNELDQFIKHTLRASYYARYTDDFVIVSQDKEELDDILGPIRKFVSSKLKLELHPNKVSIRKLHNGVDFLGYIVLPHHKLLRRKTERRIYKGLLRKVQEYKDGKVDKDSVERSLHSYLGALSHADTYRAREDLINLCWFVVND